MAKVVLNKIAYEPHPVSSKRKQELNAQGYKIIDAVFAPKGYLREDGPTVAEFIAAGYAATNYPPKGYASRSTDAEIAAAVVAQAEAGAKQAAAEQRPHGAVPGEQIAGIDPDTRPAGAAALPAGDDLDDLDAEQLHALAKERGVKVHHASGAEKVREALREAAAN